MAHDLRRAAKSGSDWGTNELYANRISIVEQEQDTFFGGPLPTYGGPAGFLQHEERVKGLDNSSLALMKRLDQVMYGKAGDESAVGDFAVELLRAMGYEKEATVVVSQKRIPLIMCGEQVYAKTDVCVLDIAPEFLLLVQGDESNVNPRDPEPQLIAGAIAAFQYNNAKRVNDLFMDPLETMIIPGITMARTFPKFYKIKVTAGVDRSIRYGTFPEEDTIVYRHTPRVPKRRSDGMRPLDNRELILRCYEGFKRVVFAHPP